MGHVRKRTKRRETFLWRLRRGLTQGQVGARLDPPVTQQTYSKYESGEVVPSLAHQRQIAAFYSVPVHTIWPTVAPRRRRTRRSPDQEEATA